MSVQRRSLALTLGAGTQCFGALEHQDRHRFALLSEVVEAEDAGSVTFAQSLFDPDVPRLPIDFAGAVQSVLTETQIEARRMLQARREIPEQRRAICLPRILGTGLRRAGARCERQTLTLVLARVGAVRPLVPRAAVAQAFAAGREDRLCPDGPRRHSRRPPWPARRRSN